MYGFFIFRVVLLDKKVYFYFFMQNWLITHLSKTADCHNMRKTKIGGKSFCNICGLYFLRELKKFKVLSWKTVAQVCRFVVH